MKATLDTKRIANHIIVRVKLRRGREWAVRRRFAIWLFRLAASIMWVKIEIGIDKRD